MTRVSISILAMASKISVSNLIVVCGRKLYEYSVFRKENCTFPKLQVNFLAVPAFPDVRAFSKEIK
jgi:hypothetical protein